MWLLYMTNHRWSLKLRVRIRPGSWQSLAYKTTPSYQRSLRLTIVTAGIICNSMANNPKALKKHSKNMEKIISHREMAAEQESSRL